MNIIALIPARSGSKRVPGKNVRLLAGHPLLFYTIAAAQQSEIFSRIYVSSDDPRILYMAEMRGAIPIPRPERYATDNSPDIEWVADFFDNYWKPTDDEFKVKDAFSILRPTSPFRSAETIVRACKEFQHRQPCDSIRAVEKTRQSPYKMWKIHKDKEMEPLSGGVHWIGGYWVPSHSRPTQDMPQYYIQNASLEMAWTGCVTEARSISGDRVKPFFTKGYEGFDINTEEDFILAETLIERGLAILPEVK